MWDEVARHLAGFDTAVLNASDAEGYPYSVRCRPVPDPAARLLRLDLGASGDALRPGPASLLCHGHDEALWNQKAFLLRGRLDPDGGTRWNFAPESFIPGIGVGGARGMARFLIGARRSAAAYLKRRGLARPRVPWDEFGRVKEREGGGNETGGRRVG